MAGQKFQYDESGSTFFYFLISFLGLVLVPCSFYFWPAETEEQIKKGLCQCPGCSKKEVRLQKPIKWYHSKKTLQRLGLVIGWIVMALLVYKVQEFDYEYANFDPYEILEISTSSSTSDIKRAYRKLSLVLHPDKPTGDERKFMRLNKAYQALTDEIARKNYELYGNPDGPGVMNFGIALPSWIIEKQNSLWVLGVYVLLFMICLPTAVAVWWYRSSKFSNDQVLMDTTQLYYYFFHKTPQMIFKRALMVLAGSLEFERGHNPEIIERPSDNSEVPWLIKQMPLLSEKNKEKPLCFPYSMKARAILHAHLLRFQLNEQTLDIDRLYIIQQCPTLINEMVSCVSQLIMLAHAGRIARLPSLDTIEAVMRLSPCIVQGLWEGKNPLLMLPHMNEDSLRQLLSKRRTIRSIQHLAAMPDDERRNALKDFTDEQYDDIVNVLATLPIINMAVNYEVVDDDDTGTFTAGAIVTVTVRLRRDPMKTIFGDKQVTQQLNQDKSKEDGEEGKKSNWRQKHGKTAKTQKKKIPPKPTQQKDNKKLRKTKLKKGGGRVEDLDEDSNDEDSCSHSDESIAEKADSESHRDKNEYDDDLEWERCQKGLVKKEKVLEGKSKVSHTVHCPYFTDDKQEYWWIYVCDHKKHMLITAPRQITHLQDEVEEELKLTAPMKPGIYSFQVCLRSDSYIGMDQSVDIRLDVKEAKEPPATHPQWNEFSSDEEDHNALNIGQDLESDFTTDDDVSDSE